MLGDNLFGICSNLFQSESQILSELYKVTWQYKVSSYTYQKSFKSKDEAINFINTEEDLISAINIKLYHIKTTEEEICYEKKEEKA